MYIGTSPDLLVSGPLIPVILAAPEATAAPLEVYATIDTAYPYNFIQEGVATALGLTPHRTTFVTTPTKYLCESDVYWLRVVFPSGHIRQLQALEVPYMTYTDARIKCIFGRSLLASCIFRYDGPHNAFSLIFKG